MPDNVHSWFVVVRQLPDNARSFLMHRIISGAPGDAVTWDRSQSGDLAPVSQEPFPIESIT